VASTLTLNGKLTNETDEIII